MALFYRHEKSKSPSNRQCQAAPPGSTGTSPRPSQPRSSCRLPRFSRPFSRSPWRDTWAAEITLIQDAGAAKNREKNMSIWAGHTCTSNSQNISRQQPSIRQLFISLMPKISRSKRPNYPNSNLPLVFPFNPFLQDFSASHVWVLEGIANDKYSIQIPLIFHSYPVNIPQKMHEIPQSGPPSTKSLSWWT